MIEVLIISVLVLWSAVVVFKKVLPKTANRLSMHIADFCAKQGWQGLAKWFTLKMATGCGAGCGCGHESDVADGMKNREIKTVKWK